MFSSVEVVQGEDKESEVEECICDDCTWGDCDNCPLDEHPTNSEIDMLDVGDR